MDKATIIKKKENCGKTFKKKKWEKTFSMSLHYLAKFLAHFRSTELFCATL